MFVSKQKTAPNGATLGHHWVVSTVVEYHSTDFRLTIHSWPDEAARLSGNPEVWRYSALIPTASVDFSGGFAQGLLAALVNTPEWMGGVVSVSLSPTLEGKRETKWNELKAERARREFGTFVYSGWVFNCDEVAQRRIVGAVLAAVIAQVNSAPYTTNWTLADDSVQSLTGAQVVAMGLALLAQVNSIHDTARTLRAALDAAITEEDIEAINWP